MDDHWRALGGHYEQATYKWIYMEAPRLKGASMEQAWAEAAEWLSRRLRQLTNFATRWWASETDETRRQAIHVAYAMLAHEIDMPLMRGQLAWGAVQWPAIVNTVGSIDVDRMTAQELQCIDCVATLLDVASWEAMWGDEYDPTAPWCQPPAALEREEYSVLDAVEAGSPWPEPQSTILFYLLAKPAGGYRNLGSELARLWETIWFPCARRWGEASRRVYDWAAKGRSSERAAWVQALLCEASVAEGLEYAVTYFDLVMCFEYVTHELVWKAGSRWGNRLTLKVVLRIYAMVRRIVLDGCYTRGRRWARGIVAGSRFAPLCLNMVLYMVLGGVVEAFPWAGACLFFDDLAMATHGVGEFVQCWHSQLVQTLINMFEVVLDMRVSRGEGGNAVALASTSALNAELGKRVRTRGVRAVKFAARRDRVARVWRAGGPAHEVIRRAKVPSLPYGVNVMGMADTKLGELRQSVATATAGNAKGRSTCLTLLADDVDPGILASASPILAWAQTWQEAEGDPSLVPTLQAACKRLVFRVGHAKAPWQQVRGPAAAFVATVKRLGWVTQAAHSITIGSNIIDLRAIPLHERHRYVRAATEQGLEDAWLAKWGGEFNMQSIFAEPARALLRRGCVPKERHHLQGVRAICKALLPWLHAICKACHQGEGTDRHRILVCEARQEERRRVGGAHIVQRGANPWPGSEQLWGRGLANDPAVMLGLWDLAVADTIRVEGGAATSRVSPRAECTPMAACCAASALPYDAEEVARSEWQQMDAAARDWWRQQALAAEGIAGARSRKRPAEEPGPPRAGGPEAVEDSDFELVGERIEGGPASGPQPRRAPAPAAAPAAEAAGGGAASRGGERGGGQCSRAPKRRRAPAAQAAAAGGAPAKRSTAAPGGAAPAPGAGGGGAAAAGAAAGAAAAPGEWLWPGRARAEKGEHVDAEAPSVSAYVGASPYVGAFSERPQRALEVGASSKRLTPSSKKSGTADDADQGPSAKGKKGKKGPPPPSPIPDLTELPAIEDASTALLDAEGMVRTCALRVADWLDRVQRQLDRVEGLESRRLDEVARLVEAEFWASDPLLCLWEERQRLRAERPAGPAVGLRALGRALPVPGGVEPPELRAPPAQPARRPAEGLLLRALPQADEEEKAPEE
ncbi:unnamed protein product, partial [Prorocentrum cordatum]